MKIAIIGPGRSGKDEAAAWFNRHTRLRFSRSTSEVIAPHVARDLGITPAEAFATRHLDRDRWRAKGDELREHDPAFLARETLKDGDICVGIRARVEMLAAIRAGLIDLVIWVERDVPPDPTLEYSAAEFADVIIPNNQAITDFHTRLRRLANALGVLKTG